MSKVSMAFGRMINDFLKDNGFTFRGAALKSSVSAAYWKDMSDGRVPSEEIIEKIAASFDELDENKLREAAGYAPKMADMDAVEAVAFALRGNIKISAEGKEQILSFVKQIKDRYGVEESNK